MIKPVYPLEVDLPAFAHQQRVQAFVTVTHTRCSQVFQTQSQFCLRISPVAIVIDGPLQFQHPTGSSFRDLKTTAQKLRLDPFAHRLQNFFLSTSCSMCLSRVRSATSAFSFLFSSSNCRSRVSSAIPMPATRRFHL